MLKFMWGGMLVLGLSVLSVALIEAKPIGGRTEPVVRPLASPDDKKVVLPVPGKGYVIRADSIEHSGRRVKARAAELVHDQLPGVKLVSERATHKIGSDIVEFDKPRLVFERDVWVGGSGQPIEFVADRARYHIKTERFEFWELRVAAHDLACVHGVIVIEDERITFEVDSLSGTARLSSGEKAGGSVKVRVRQAAGTLNSEVWSGRVALTGVDATQVSVDRRFTAPTGSAIFGPSFQLLSAELKEAQVVDRLGRIEASLLKFERPKPSGK